MIERERKFLLKNDSWKTRPRQVSTIKQHYLHIGPESETRIRSAVPSDGSPPSYLFTAKYGCGESRKEVNRPLTRGEYLDLMEVANAGSIYKTRHRLLDIPPGRACEIFVDEYIDGTTLMEIELTDPKAEWRAIWMPNFTGDEVTDNPMYYNANMAQIDTINGEKK